DETYTTPTYHNNPLEPLATIAVWDGDRLTVYDSNQGPFGIQGPLAAAFGVARASVRVVSPYVGGGFGCKVLPKPHHALAVMAARAVGRPVKLALSRQQMFATAGHRTPTIQRVRLGADRDGRLVAVAADVVEHTGTTHEFAEQTGVPARLMYA